MGRNRLLTCAAWIRQFYPSPDREGGDSIHVSAEAAMGHLAIAGGNGPIDRPPDLAASDPGTNLR